MQVRDLDSDVQERLRAAAEREGLSLSAFLRRELTRLADLFEVRARAEALQSRNPFGGSFPELAGIDVQEIVQMIREDRDSR